MQHYGAWGEASFHVYDGEHLVGSETVGEFGGAMFAGGAGGGCQGRRGQILGFEGVEGGG